MNNQPIEKKRPTRQHSSDVVLDVHSIFHTIQGEGPFSGHRAVFVRLAGCNLQCPRCDTDYTSSRIPMTPAEILDRVNVFEKDAERPEHTRPLVVLTGGEPFRQDIVPLVQTLAINDYQVQIETNGTLYRDFLPYGVTIVCSPKSGKIDKDLLPRISAFKYVIEAGCVSPTDGLPTHVLGAHGVVARPPEGFRGPIYVQPMDAHDTAANERHMRAAVESVMKFGYTLCLQAHKIANVE